MFLSINIFYVQDFVFFFASGVCVFFIRAGLKSDEGDGKLYTQMGRKSRRDFFLSPRRNDILNRMLLKLKFSPSQNLCGEGGCEKIERWHDDGENHEDVKDDKGILVALSTSRGE